MKRLIAMTAVLAALTAACAESGAQPIGPAPSIEPPTPSTSPSPTPSPAVSPSPTATQSMTYELWFTYDGSLFLTHRTEPFTPAVGTRALEALLDGPTQAERAADLGTSINAGTTLRGLTIDDNVATVDLDGTFVEQETPAIAVGSLAQIVYTLTQFDRIHGVVFEVDGSPLTNFGGYEIDGAQRRANFADQLPFILVQTPGIGERVSSPVHISGTADVFEAVVSIAILDQHGKVIASTFTMATCGTGCRGTWETDVDYDVASTQPGTIRVYEVSAMDGSEIHVVNIPVTLTA
jgi:Immunoglobulin-like domain of bacterial spore germination/Sporulation and spore germination